MARSPFQGTFQPNIRPTVVTAPDAIVFINGEQEIIGCPNCSRAFNFNKYITSIQTDLSVDSAPGSATISLSIPRHTIDDFYFDGNAVISPMMEVEIFAKGYYLVEGVPQYYPIFWGLVTEVGDNYSGGEHTVSIHCADILKWWEICKMNINPAYTVPSGQTGRNVITGNTFAQSNPYDIIFTLALQSFGDVIVGTGSLNNFVQESKQRSTFNAALSDIMFYWQKRFSRVRSNLLLYGTQGVAVRGDTLYQNYSRQNLGPTPTRTWVAAQVQNGNGGPDGGNIVFNPSSNAVTPYRFVLSNAGQIDLWQSEYQTKLEIANACKEAIGFEFYMDVTGDIVFKPPFYNLDILSNKPTSWIQDIDVIDWDFSESESEVVTQIVLQGQYGGTQDYGMPAELSPFTTVTDYHLLRKYGWRSQNYNSEFMSSPQLMFYHGLDVLDRINSKRHRGSVSIPMRPELRLGFPIYVAPKDQIWYVNGISHNIAFGSRATTSLTLTAKRSKFIAPKGIGDIKLKTFNKQNIEVDSSDSTPRSFRYSSNQLSRAGVFELEIGAAGSIPPDAGAFSTQSGADNPYEPLVLRHPKTGRIVGYPNVVMVYTRPFDPTDSSFQAGQKTPTQVDLNIAERGQALLQKRREANSPETLARLGATPEDSLTDKYLTNRYQYGLNSAGVFIYAHDSSAGGGVISEILTLPSSNITPPSTTAIPKGKTALIRPVSDERGFEVVGHYQYGRRVFLKDGRLIINGQNVTKAKVELQLALSGGLSETLTAQSQGLTTVSTGYQDPAATLAIMTADEKQTAAIAPDSKTPKFVDVGDNFIDSAPLGSQEQQGSPEIEASQLSRALTLAEMSVKDSHTRNDEDCVCLTGRADLAFMNSGYQVKTLTGKSVEDTSVLQSLEAIGIDSSSRTGRPIQVGSTQAEIQAVTAAESKLSQAEARLTVLQQELASDPEKPAKIQAVSEQQGVVSNLETQLANAQATLDSSRKKHSVTNTVFTRTPSELISKVDQFLVDLYSKLDDPHQQFESAIRGDLLPQQPGNVSGLGAAAVNPPSEFAPPFSAPNRFQLGDPKADVGAVESNTANLAKSWSDFGNNLRKDSERSALSKQISTDKADIARLTAQVTQLKKQQSSSAIVIGVNLQAEIDSRNKQIAQLEKDVLDKQTQLNTHV